MIKTIDCRGLRWGVAALLLFVSLTLSARERQDVIYLKNGEMVRGEIIGHEYQGFNTLVQIRTADGNVLTFQMDEVEMISNAEEKGGKDGENEGAQWGLRTGMNFSKMTGTYLGEDYSSLLGFHFGVVVDVPLYKDNLYLQPGFYYMRKGFKQEYDYEYRKQSLQMEVKQRLNYFEIPLLLSGRYTFGIAQLQLNFGPYISFGGWGRWNAYLNGDLDESESDTPGKVWDAGLIIGAGVLLNRHFYIGFQYDFGLIDFYGEGLYNYGYGGYDYSGGEKTKTRSGMISIGYNF